MKKRLYSSLAAAFTGGAMVSACCLIANIGNDVVVALTGVLCILLSTVFLALSVR